MKVIDIRVDYASVRPKTRPPVLAIEGRAGVFSWPGQFFAAGGTMADIMRMCGRDAVITRIDVAIDVEVGRDYSLAEMRPRCRGRSNAKVWQIDKMNGSDWTIMIGSRGSMQLRAYYKLAKFKPRDKERWARLGWGGGALNRVEWEVGRKRLNGMRLGNWIEVMRIIEETGYGVCKSPMSIDVDFFWIAMAAVPVLPDIQKRETGAIAYTGAVCKAPPITALMQTDESGELPIVPQEEIWTGDGWGVRRYGFIPAQCMEQTNISTCSATSHCKTNENNGIGPYTIRSPGVLVK